MVDTGEHEDSPVVVADDVAGHASLACLQSLVREILEAESGGIVGGGLFGVTNPEVNVVYVMSRQYQNEGSCQSRDVRQQFLSWYYP